MLVSFPSGNIYLLPQWEDVHLTTFHLWALSIQMYWRSHSIMIHYHQYHIVYLLSHCIYTLSICFFLLMRSSKFDKWFRYHDEVLRTHQINLTWNMTQMLRRYETRFVYFVKRYLHRFFLLKEGIQYEWQLQPHQLFVIHWNGYHRGFHIHFDHPILLSNL